MRKLREVNVGSQSPARVAEMLRSLVAYARGAGLDARWVVIDGPPEFFRLTKRLHNAIHGSDGDGSELGEAERQIYERTLRANAVELCAVVQRRDVVFLHDPQTAGLIPDLVQGAHDAGPQDPPGASDRG